MCVCAASKPSEVLFILIKRPDWTRNGAFRKRNASSENSPQSDMKSSMVKGKEAEWIGWKSIRRSGTRFEGVAWVPVGAPDESLLELTTFAFVLTHISSFLPRWPSGTWHGGDPDRRKRKRESNIPHTSSASTWLVLNGEHLSTECNMRGQQVLVASIRILRCYKWYAYREWLRVSNFNIVGRYAHKDNCVKKLKGEISG